MAKYILAGIALLIGFIASAQQNQNHQHETPSPYYAYGKGLGITSPDSLFMLNIRFRIQNRFAFTTNDVDDLNIDEVEARVRRMRLRFDGFIYDPRLTYIIQLS
ncbi:MAG: porin, partial [Chryseotalea sp.]